MISNNKFKILIKISSSILFLLIIQIQDTGGSGGSDKLELKSSKVSIRVKRNIGQLAQLIEDYTHYSANQLVFHGNWCGLGGNRAQDNSVQDACDACCKKHDLCYDHLLTNTRESVTTVTDGIVGYITERYSGGGDERKKKQQGGQRDWATRSCFPYVDTYELSHDRGRRIQPTCNGSGNDGRPCAREVCLCDTKFVSCLRRTKCRLRRRTIRNLLF